MIEFISLTCSKIRAISATIKNKLLKNFVHRSELEIKVIEWKPRWIVRRIKVWQDRSLGR